MYQSSQLLYYYLYCILYTLQVLVFCCDGHMALQWDNVAIKMSCEHIYPTLIFNISLKIDLNDCIFDREVVSLYAGVRFLSLRAVSCLPDAM